MNESETFTRTVTVDGVDVPVTWTEQGSGAVMLLLHGGGGPASVESFARYYAETCGARVLVPRHPGFDGTPRPDALDSIAGLARSYVALLDQLGLDDVTVVGNSIGGWITAEIGLLVSRRVARLVIVDGMGLELPHAPIPDFFSLSMAQVADHSYYEPDKFRIDPDALPPAARETMAGNRAALLLYGGTSMADPTLLGRLGDVAAPALVVWGTADRIVSTDHGRAYAEHLPAARLEIIETAGHLPQLATPDVLAQLIADFAGATRRNPTAARPA